MLQGFRFLLIFGLIFMSNSLFALNKDSIASFENANQPFITCSENSYQMYNAELLNSDSAFILSFNRYLKTWDEKRPSVYKSAKYLGNGSVKLLLFPDSGAYSMPCDNNLVTSRYGWRRGRMHRGTDVDLETGDELRSVMDGVVRFAGWYSGYGYCVLIRHINGLETLYAHMSKLSVKSGQFVSHGEKIGLGGTTGHSTGSHLHFEVHFMGKAMNPEIIFNFKTGKAKTNYLIISSDGKAKAFEPLTDSLPVQEIVIDTQDSSSEQVVKKSIAKKPSAQTIKYHFVKKGETLYRISKRYGISVSTLCRLNRIRSTSTLRIGQRLRVK